MSLESLFQDITNYVLQASGNHISAEDAIRPELADMRIYDEPLLGVASANDPLFLRLREPDVVGSESLLPTDFFVNAKSVLSVFLPFTEKIKRGNAVSMDKPSDEWLHGRIEGQQFQNELGEYICSLLEADGYSAVYSAQDSRFRKTAMFASNWSERHVAHVCGLGTFGLSRGLITSKGMAGRIISIVTTAPLQATPRPYSDPFEYCIMCGKCQQNCPADAIDIKKGIIDAKDQVTCAIYVRSTGRPPHGPHKIERYGCGKCQVNVPCESGLPKLMSL